ncbi:RNA-directed DNA polymerase from mobile element jockey [Holothuria leucospilota]|uniref:RNA-directed DNA polymerase from mobile element jockey n=1 Tax=Holothuria leucospilota TaxID=206669 RepID=A0A9Q1BBP3_HOLLE|nr:RNA-directed DNA polymerase from mobile element jockey [Holothuria leucospilota]
MATDTLSQLNIWFESNKLTLHVDKTSFTIFHARKNCNHACIESFYFNGTRIRKSHFTQYLGLVIDENLTWKQHVNDLRNSLLKYIGIFHHIGDILPADTAIQIYYSFIYSRLTYAIEVYGTACTTVIKPLQTFQNRILKLLLKKPRRFNTNQLYLDCKVLKINDIHMYCMGVIVFKVDLKSRITRIYILEVGK